MSPSTVDFHVSNILGKLGAATRTEAVAIACNTTSSTEGRARFASMQQAGEVVAEWIWTLNPVHGDTVDGSC